MRSTLKIFLAATTLVGFLAAPAPASAAERAATRTPVSEALTFRGASGSVAHGAYTGAASFGIRTLHARKGDVRFFALYFEVTSRACDAAGCTVKSDVIYSREADRRVSGRITVAPDLRTATLAPTRLPVVHTSYRIGNDGSSRFTSTTTYDLVRGTAVATGPGGFQKTVEPYGDAFLVIRGPHAPARLRITIGGTPWSSKQGDGTVINSTTSRLWSAPPA